MGRGCLGLLIVLLITGCSEQDAGSGRSEHSSEGPRSEATEFTWSRFSKQGSPPSLQTEWTLSGSRAVSVSGAEDTLYLSIDRPLIRFFPEPGNTARNITVQSRNADFSEQEDRISFYPAVLVQSFTEGTVPEFTLTSGKLIFRNREQTCTCSEEFYLTSSNIMISGTQVVFMVREQTARIAGPSSIRVNAKNFTHSPSIPDNLKPKALETPSVSRSARIENSGNTDIDLVSGIIKLSGPVTVTSDLFRIRGTEVELNSSTEETAAKQKETVFRKAKIKGSVLFSELTGEQRQVSCGACVYEALTGRAVMTEKPVLTSSNIRVSSSRITYLPEEKKFIFADPYTLEQLREKPDTVKND